MRKFEKVEKEDLVDITCDVCHKSCKTDYGFEYSTLLATWGYCSARDGEMHEAHFCESCHEALINHIYYQMGGTIDIKNYQ